MPNETAFTRPIGGKVQFQYADRAIAALAERQHGVVARAQLVDLGLGEDAIDGRLEKGRLHRLHRGVYSVGHRLVSQESQWMEAVLVGGGDAVLSHRSAAALWGLQRAARTRIEITTPRATRSRESVHRHYAKLPADEVTVRRRIPVTTASRTLLDLAAVVPVEALGHALREAEVRRLHLRPSFDALLARYQGRRGTAALRSCLHRLERLPAGQTHNRFEDRFLAFIARYDLPQPQTNVLLELGGKTIEADCLWREQRLIVELDGHEAHGTRSAFESDRERDRRLQAAGWAVVRVTWHQLEDEPKAILADLRRLLDVG
jgi:putative AbiEi antitoxin of type IV toxin-antitoxin system/uncharacterized protein DUF559